ncbi:phenoloxidase 2-like [Zeugodacus cucurbitae]|uniref:phenoloxidase 2-like n=1 Tax=Zeugodacus cucurbitae TaxID=28588 RepID=UPI0023D924C6|nr:phenoloxidase 2-like [Zeugodacus cucurbitae]
MGARSVDDLQSVSVYARDRVNPYLFNYAVSVALLHRPDTKGLDLPSIAHNFLDKFVDSQVFIPITILWDYTASDLEAEHRLWYYWEDLGISLHHLYWHLVYPFKSGDRAIVNEDRRGKLFYYMHQQVVARYHLQRFRNNLARVVRFNN